MKTPFLNNLANGSYATLQLLNDFSAFTSDNVVRSLAARYGWVVGGRAFGKIQGKVLPQGGGPFGRYMRVKGGQFSRNALGNMMNFFTTTEMEFTNVNRTQRNIMNEHAKTVGFGKALDVIWRSHGGLGKSLEVFGHKLAQSWKQTTKGQAVFGRSCSQQAKC